jgi:hypothetical protein
VPQLPPIDGEIIYQDNEITILRAPLPGQFDYVSAFNADGVAETVTIGEGSDLSRVTWGNLERWRTAGVIHEGSVVTEEMLEPVNLERGFINKFGQPVTGVDSVPHDGFRPANPALAHLTITGTDYDPTSPSGVVDASGNVVIPSENQAILFYDPFIVVARVVGGANSHLIYDASGNFLISGPWFAGQAGHSDNGMISITRGMSGFVHLNGQIVVPMEYEHVNPFNNGIATVRYNGQWYVLEIVRQGGPNVQPSSGGASEGPPVMVNPAIEATPAATPVPQPGIEIVLEADTVTPSPSEMSAAISKIRTRLDYMGIIDSSVEQRGANQIIVTMPAGATTNVELTIAEFG